MVRALGGSVMFQSALGTLKKYADFKGRASRAEFWTFFLFVVIAQAVAGVVDLLFGGGRSGVFSLLAGVLLFVPQLAVTVRRLHDVNRSGRELVVPFLMLVAMPLFVIFRGFIAGIIMLGYSGIVLLLFANLLLLLIKQGSSIPNKYGASPKAFSFAG
jgi:uncharacterized membrane protein YhaH (DUF805 family)